MRVRQGMGELQGFGSCQVCPRDESETVVIITPQGTAFNAWPLPRSAAEALRKAEHWRAVKETAARAVCAGGGMLLGFFWQWLFGSVGLWQ